MHFRTLVTVDIPAIAEDETKNQEIRDAIDALEKKMVNQPPNFVAELFLSGLYSKVNTFSRSVCESVADVMAPYCESTEDPEYTEFVDYTENLKADFAEKIDCLRLAEGKIVEHCSYPYYYKYSIRDGKVFQKEAGPLHHEKRTKKAKRITALPEYPRVKLYKSFEDYAGNYRGFVFDTEHKAFGYYCNPNAMWDWYQIGGRWPAMFLVKDTCTEYSYGERSWSNGDKAFAAPEEFHWVAAARKRDIEWQAMREWRDKETAERFYRLEKMFAARYLEEGFYGEITDDGIICCREYTYRKGETVDAYLERMGIPKSWKYPLRVSDVVDADNWVSQEDSVVNPETEKWEPIDWHHFIDQYVDDLDDDMVLVGVDYHM